MKKKKHAFLGFSIMELLVSFMVVAIVAAAATPVLFKKSSKMKLKNLNSLTTSCENCSDDLKNNCQLFKKSVINGTTTYTCAVCKASAVKDCKNQGEGHYFDKTNCTCGSCSKFNTMVNPTCSNCCTRCNSEYCTGCNKGVGLPEEKRKDKMGCTVCSSGTYSDNSDGVAEKCKKCPAGYYCPEDRMTDGKKYKCPIGHYCPEGSINPTPCPSGYYCPNEGMTDGKKYKCPAGCACPSKMGGLSENLSLTEIGRNLKCPMKVDDGNKTYPCAKNYYCPEGTESTTKNSCDSWRRFSVTKFKGAAGTSYCECKEGYYLLNGVCSKCPKGTFKYQIGNEYTYCLDCPPGTYCPDEGTTTDPTGDSNRTCPCSTYSTGRAVSCSGCAAPNLASTKGSTSSAACKHCDYYQPSKCGCCPANAVACDDNGKATKCKCGYQLSNGSCVACTGATYSGEGGSCTACSSGAARPDHCGCCPSNCATCNDGGTCTACAGGYYLENGICKKCSDKWGDHCVTCNTSGCLSCSAGWTAGVTLINNTKSTKCCRNIQASDCGSNTLCIHEGNNANNPLLRVNAQNVFKNNEWVVTPEVSCAHADCCWKSGSTETASENFTALHWVNYSKKERGCVYNKDWSGGNGASDPATHYYDNVTKKWVGNPYTSCHRVVCVSTSTGCDYAPGLVRKLNYSDIANNKAVQQSLHFCDMSSNVLGFPLCKNNETNCDGSTACKPSVVYFGDGAKYLSGGTWKTAGTGSAGSIRCARKWICD